MKSGFVTIVGRPNVGKSSLLNNILGQKVSIVSNKPQTTRTQIRGVLTRNDAQIIFVDTPGLHKPKTVLGQRLNDSANEALSDVDLKLFVFDATAPFGDGDKRIAESMGKDAICVLNKTDIAKPTQIIEQLSAAAPFDFSEYFPISARTGDGIAELVDAIANRLPEGPLLYPADVVTEVPEAFWVAELVREELLKNAEDELPHSIACVVTEWEWPRVRCEILVERDSQKGIVIGKDGENLKRVGTAVRKQMDDGAFLELFVKVDSNWQRKPKALVRLGY